MPPHEPNAGFPSTQWSVIDRAGAASSPLQRRALGEVLGQYLPALRVHLLLRRRAEPGETDDLVQGFVSSKLLESDLLASADRSRGKFRTYLLTALDRFVISQRREAQAQKRGASRTTSLDAPGLFTDTRSAATPADAFDVEWSRQLLRQALDRMRAQCLAAGREDLWDVFDGRVLAPTLRNEPPAGYEQIVSRWNYRSPTQLWNAVRSAKQLFARTLRAVVLEYVPTQEQAEEELRDLQRICAAAGLHDSASVSQSPDRTAYP